MMTTSHYLLTKIEINIIQCSHKNDNTLVDVFFFNILINHHR